MNVCVAHLQMNACVAKNFGAWTEKVGHPCFKRFQNLAAHIDKDKFKHYLLLKRFQNLAAHIDKNKFKHYLLTYNTLRKIVYDNSFKLYI